MVAQEADGALRLPLSQREFDLAEVMSAVGDHSHLRWVLRDAYFNGDVVPVWPEGIDYAEAASARPGGLPMTWAEMHRLAESCHQVIDGRFTGYQRTGEAALMLLVVDSGFWVVWARDAAVLDKVSAAFPYAEASTEPIPAPLSDRN